MEGSYDIVYMKTALRHLEEIKRSGDRNTLKKIYSLIEEIRVHPKKGTGHPKPLGHHSGETWARKINEKDRLVYEIFEDRKLITINRARGHYNDR